MRGFLCLLAFTISRLALGAGQDCDALKSYHSVDLRSQFGPMRNQHDLSWCFAEGMADQLTYQAVQKHVPGIGLDRDHMVSSAALVFGAHAQEREPLLPDLRKEFGEFRESEPALKRAQAQLARAQEHFREVEARIAKGNPVLAAFVEQANLAPQGGGGLAPVGGMLGDYGGALVRHVELCSRLSGECKKAAKNVADAQEAAGQAFEVSQKYLLFHQSTAATGGDPGLAAGAAMNQGLCTEKEVPTGLVNRNGMIDRKYLFSLEAFDDFTADPSSVENCEAMRAAVPHLFPQFLDDVKPVLARALDRSPAEEFLASCRARQVPFTLWTIARRELGEIDQALDDKHPVGASLHSNVFFYGKEQYEQSSHLGDFHYVVLVGKQYNCATHQEEYLVRNSWGKEACEKDRAIFRSLPAADPRLTQIREKDYACVAACRAKPGAEKCYQACEHTRSDAWKKLNRPPYRCTADGYFVVPKNMLEKSFVNANYLE